jgi:hypothetical protein
VLGLPASIETISAFYPSDCQYLPNIAFETGSALSAQSVSALRRSLRPMCDVILNRRQSSLRAVTCVQLHEMSRSAEPQRVLVPKPQHNKKKRVETMDIEVQPWTGLWPGGWAGGEASKRAYGPYGMGERDTTSRQTLPEAARNRRP